MHVERGLFDVAVAVDLHIVLHNLPIGGNGVVRHKLLLEKRRTKSVGWFAITNYGKVCIGQSLSECCIAS